MPKTATSPHPLTRTALAVVAALLLIAGWIFAAPPASAHDELLGSDPAADATLDAPPAALTLTFSGAISTEPGASEVQVTDAAGTSLTAGDPTAQDNVLTQPLSDEAAGAITVLWKVVSSDGHPISGEYSFTVNAPAPTETVEPTETATPEPSETAAPTATASTTPEPTDPASDEGSSALPWIIGGIVVLGVAAGVAYLLISRSRREKALRAASGDSAQTDSDPSSER